jgi:hypothetical protein
VASVQGFGPSNSICTPLGSSQLWRARVRNNSSAKVSAHCFGTPANLGTSIDTQW